MVAPPWLVFSMGMMTVRSGSALRVTVTSTVFSLTLVVVGGAPEAHRDVTALVAGVPALNVVVGDGDGARGPEAQLLRHAGVVGGGGAALVDLLYALAVVVDGVGLGGESSP